MLVRSRIEYPETIKNSAPPQQSSCGETGHGSTKEQEMPIAVNPGVVGRTASRGWCDSLLCILLNISQRFNS
jgi:hypothetical protein